MTFYDHLPSSLCWCAPRLMTEYETISAEVYPGVYASEVVTSMTLEHWDFQVRRHGRPREPVSLMRYVPDGIERPDQWL